MLSDYGLRQHLKVSTNYFCLSWQQPTLQMQCLALCFISGNSWGWVLLQIAALLQTIYEVQNLKPLKMYWSLLIYTELFFKVRCRETKITKYTSYYSIFKYFRKKKNNPQNLKTFSRVNNKSTGRKDLHWKIKFLFFFSPLQCKPLKSHRMFSLPLWTCSPNFYLIMQPPTKLFRWSCRRTHEEGHFPNITPHELVGRRKMENRNARNHALLHVSQLAWIAGGHKSSLSL